MERDPEIEEIQLDWHERDKLRRRYVIVEQDDGSFEVQVHTADSTHPPTRYDTAAQACSRVLQMLGVEHGIVPQRWPERIGIDRPQPTAVPDHEGG